MLLSVPFDWCRLAFWFISFFFHSTHLLSSSFPRHGSLFPSVELYKRICSRLLLPPDSSSCIHTPYILYLMSSTSVRSLRCSSHNAFAAFFFFCFIVVIFLPSDNYFIQNKEIKRGLFIVSPTGLCQLVGPELQYTRQFLKHQTHNSSISLLIVF